MSEAFDVVDYNVAISAVMTLKCKHAVGHCEAFDQRQHNRRWLEIQPGPKSSSVVLLLLLDLFQTEL